MFSPNIIEIALLTTPCRRVFPLAALLAATLFAGPAEAASSRRKVFTPSLPIPKECQEGTASWHVPEPGSSESRTASNRPWKNTEFVAAHRTLPLGTKVRVINLKNDRSVVVEITDRGPYCHGRIIDLSLVAAIRLDMTSSGTAHVRLEVLATEQRAAAAPGLSVEVLAAMAAAPLQGWFLALPAS